MFAARISQVDAIDRLTMRLIPNSEVGMGGTGDTPVVIAVVAALRVAGRWPVLPTGMAAATSEFELLVVVTFSMGARLCLKVQPQRQYQEIARWNFFKSQRLFICCGWCFAHSRAPAAHF